MIVPALLRRALDSRAGEGRLERAQLWDRIELKAAAENPSASDREVQRLFPWETSWPWDIISRRWWWAQTECGWWAGRQRVREVEFDE